MLEPNYLICPWCGSVYSYNATTLADVNLNTFELKKPCENPVCEGQNLMFMAFYQGSLKLHFYETDHSEGNIS